MHAALCLYELMRQCQDERQGLLPLTRTTTRALLIAIISCPFAQANHLSNKRSLYPLQHCQQLDRRRECGTAAVPRPSCSCSSRGAYSYVLPAVTTSIVPTSLILPTCTDVAAGAGACAIISISAPTKPSYESQQVLICAQLLCD